ncbi:TonB-linked SusC/RagA family outer membrane protein [Dyadobacter jejuensis]|uniref:TonB-linked SusC/RagA family outer membrane protein n=1 Tax=Dyadobacter jejuensis TaxID=1082580 RepID=A0A316AF96_9BACT|nr:TonB-dependent receptor [Dyadobacter jejuensis]PWJ55938.1 TonB-linked SusC/RagA family outer membrane protein [Dyadobacter jejuensis]
MKVNITIFSLLLMGGLIPPTIGQTLAYQPRPAAIETVQTAATLKLADVLLLFKEHYKADILYSDRSVQNQFLNATQIDWNQPIESNFKKILPSLGLDYKRQKNGGYLIVKKTKDSNSTASAQSGTYKPLMAEDLEKAEIIDKKISGTVTDASGEALPGVSVVIKNTQRGTVTDVNGHYSIDVPEQNAFVVFSYVGYVKQELEVGNRTVVDIKLKSDESALEEVVVIGYGAVEKNDLTGAVGSIQSKDIVRANPVQAAKALQGQVAGVNVQKTSNKAGAGYTIDIRGESSINSTNEPLVVVDGVMGANLNNLNPSDIQSMDVLKDASSTAIYGSRGANGVIIITTKKGTSGKPRVSYDAYVGQKTPNHLPALMTAQDFYKAYNDDRLMDGGVAEKFTTTELDMVNSGKSTDWLDLLTQPTLQTSHSLSVSGGSDNTTYYFSGGYLKEGGTIARTGFERYSIKGGLDSKLNDKVKVGFSSYYTYNLYKLGSNEAIRSAYRARPTGVNLYEDVINPAESSDLNYQGYAVWMGINDKQVLNPIVEGDRDNYQHENKGSSILANAYVEFEPFKGLTFRSSISTAFNSEREGDYRGTYTKSQQTTQKPRAQYDTRATGTYTWDNVLNYQLNKASHSLTVTAVQSAFKNRYETSTISVNNLAYESGWYALGTAANITGVGSNLSENALLSYMGRINYGFKNKYLLTLTGRSDGASQLSEGNKWAFFPSAAIAWRAGDETFIRDLNVFSDLKLRLSYGVVGNATVSPYSTQANISKTSYDFDGTPAYGFAPSNLANRQLKWEKSKEYNFGINMGFFNNRITTAIELYNRKTEDLILSQKIPTSTGFDEITANVGKIENKGVEINLNTVNLDLKGFKWSTNFNFSTNKNTILELYGGGIDEDKGNGLFVGEAVKVNYNYKFDGIWQTNQIDEAKVYNQVPGSVRVVDQNQDGKISSNDGIDDRVILGSSLPKWLLGVTNRFSYNNFDLSCFIYTRQGAQYRNNMLSGTMGEISSGRYNHLKLNYWTSQNPSNDYFGVVAANPYRTAIQYQDASFIRISDITLGYTLPGKALNRYGLSNLRVYAQASNPFVFHKFDGLDPEYNSSAYDDDVPSSILLFGLNLSF